LGRQEDKRADVLKVPDLKECRSAEDIYSYSSALL
jgi:hypothetical protein